jgi:glutamate formiminotransferase
VLECVINVSEAHRLAVVDALAATAGKSLLDLHSDADHGRSVLTLGGPDVEAAARAVAAEAVKRVDLRSHQGVHPRFGVVDVVPFVPLAGSSMAEAEAARDGFATWAAEALELPCFLYGVHRSLPEVRRDAFVTVAPDVGPDRPHPTAGACAVGARPVLVAYNLWLAAPADVALAKRIAAELRSPSLRTLGLAFDRHVQVSCNLIEPAVVGPGAVFDAVAARAAVERAELVGLVPTAVLEAEDPARWDALDLDPSRTIEARLGKAGLGGS